MPTADGPIGNPRYDTADPPLFPTHLTEISDFYAALAVPVTNYSDLAAVQGKYAGMLKSDMQTGGLWLYTGSVWTRINKLVSQGADNYSTSGANNGTTAVSFSFPSLPFATQVNLQGIGQGGFKASASAFYLQIAASAGTLSQADASTINAGTAQMVAFAKGASLVLPPNTSATVTFKVVSGDNPFFRLDAQYQRVSSV